MVRYKDARGKAACTVRTRGPRPSNDNSFSPVSKVIATSLIYIYDVFYLFLFSVYTVLLSPLLRIFKNVGFCSYVTRSCVGYRSETNITSFFVKHTNKSVSLSWTINAIYVANLTVL